MVHGRRGAAALEGRDDGVAPDRIVIVIMPIMILLQLLLIIIMIIMIRIMIISIMINSNSKSTRELATYCRFVFQR